MALASTEELISNELRDSLESVEEAIALYHEIPDLIREKKTRIRDTWK